MADKKNPFEIVAKRQEGLYDACVQANLTLDNHESDLYIKDCPKARELLEQYGKSYYVFNSQVDDQLWLDVPFAYLPFWKKAAGQ